jgi:hypothetical protein
MQAWSSPPLAAEVPQDGAQQTRSERVLRSKGINPVRVEPIDATVAGRSIDYQTSVLQNLEVL